MAGVKICGIGNAGDLIAAHAAGATWAGMVFYPASPRNLALDKAEAIAADADSACPAIRRVALTVDADDETLDAIITAARPHMLQCHGGETPERIAAIKKRFALPVMKAIPVADAASLTRARAYDSVADMLLFDSAPAPSQSADSLPGGRGETFQWNLLRAWRGTSPWMLAGGLHAGNIAAAIAASGARAVDTSSGVESAPGVKDHAAMRRFIMAASAAMGY